MLKRLGSYSKVVFITESKYLIPAFLALQQIKCLLSDYSCTLALRDLGDT